MKEQENERGEERTYRRGRLLSLRILILSATHGS